MDYDEFLAELASSADDEFREFALKGIKTERPFLGVRTPRLRELAKKMSVEEIFSHESVSYEEVAVRGFVIARMPYAEMKTKLKGFVGLFDNWGVCDTFCSSLRKSVTKNREDFLEVIDQFLDSSREFDVRFALVCLLDFYAQELDFLPVVFDRILRVKNREEYYIKMAVAWTLATCFAKFPEPTESFLLSADLLDWTFNKAISKICDSLRVDEEAKARLKKLRRPAR